MSFSSGLSPIGRYNPISEIEQDISTYTFVYETNGALSYKFPKQELQLSFYVRYNDKLIRYFQDIDDDGEAVTRQFIQNGFTFSDLTVSKYFFHKMIKVTGGIENIFNVQNVSTGGGIGGAHVGNTGSVPISMGRNWFAILSWNFGWD